jgi:DHA1 family tetracycline resistance protein-like MFS transporter
MSVSAIFKSKIFPILLVNFIGILGYSLIIPILIYIVTDFGGNGFVYGLLGATYPFFQFIGAPILGKLSDRIGRKKVLIVSQAGTFGSWCLFIAAFFIPVSVLWEQDSTITGSYSMTLPLVMIFIARTLDGFTGGNISVANAYMSDVSTDENRSDNFGKMGASTSMGFVIGPAIAGLLATTILGELLPLIIAALISLAAIFIINIRLKESHPNVVDTGRVSWRNIRRFLQVEHKDCYTEGGKNMEEESQMGWRSTLSIAGIPRLFLIYFLNFLAFSLFFAALPVYVSIDLSWTATELGIYLAFFSLIMVITQRPVLKRLSKMYSTKVLVVAGTVSLFFGFMLMSSENLFLIYLAAVFMGFGTGIMWPSFLTILSKSGTADIQGRIQGYGSSMGSMASIFGLLIGGMLVEHLGAKIFAIAGLLFLSILLALKGLKSESKVLDEGKEALGV